MNNAILNCIVVDESSIQRLAIVKMIEEHSNLRLLREFSSAIETKAGLKQLSVDLIFIDVEISVKNGFELLDDLDEKPSVIIVTNHSRHAFKAFEYNAIDYLLKPVKKERFLIAVDRALLYNKIMIETLEDRGESIFVKCNLKKRKVYLKELIYIQALGDYVKLITPSENLIVLSTMKYFENSLPKEDFLRIHKSYIVNLKKIEKFTSRTVELSSEILPLSRNRKTDLIEALSQF
jgi:DNA-binding LytR/AlgR family response regulator